MKPSIKGIAVNTFRESARNKMFYLLVFFGILFALSSKLVSFLTLGDAMKVLKDTGLAAINFFCVLIAIFTGINLVYKEIEKKTVFNILSKPVSRDEFIIGKFLGLALTMLTALGAMAVIFFAFIALERRRLRPRDRPLFPHALPRAAGHRGHLAALFLLHHPDPLLHLHRLALPDRPDHVDLQRIQGLHHRPLVAEASPRSSTTCCPT